MVCAPQRRLRVLSRYTLAARSRRLDRELKAWGTQPSICFGLCDGPLAETAPPGIRPNSLRSDALRDPVDVPELIEPERRSVIRQNTVGSSIEVYASRRIRLACRTVDHRVERGVSVRRRVISTGLDLAARPFLSHRRWRWLDVPRVEQRVEVALLHPGAEGVDLHWVDGNSRTCFSPLILKQ